MHPEWNKMVEAVWHLNFMPTELTSQILNYTKSQTSGNIKSKISITSLLVIPGQLPARVVPCGHAPCGFRAGHWRGGTGRAASLTTGVHCAGVGGAWQTGLVSDQQIPLPVYQWEHATESPLQHGEQGAGGGDRSFLVIQGFADIFKSWIPLTVK